MGLGTVAVGLLVLGVSVATLILVATQSHKSVEKHHSSHKSSHSQGDALDFFSHVAMNLSAFDHTPITVHLPHQQRTAAGEHTGPLRAARALAIIHVAMADAVAVVTRKFEPYAASLLLNAADGAAVPPTVNIHATIASAAKTTMQWLYQGQLHGIDQAWAQFRELLPNTHAVEHGILLGEAIGNLVIAQRKNDGAALAIDPPAEAYESDEPGKWRRDPVAQHTIALGATWATHVRPFTLTHASQFVCPPPPNLTSAEYSMEFYETCAVGGQADGCVRDAWRTFVGRFWAYDGTSAICAPARLYMQIVHATLRQEFRHLDLPAKARIIGLAALAMTDAGLASWHSKWLYRRERPVTAVRESAAFDGNPLTTANPNWTPLGAPNTNSPDKPSFTPPFPAFPRQNYIIYA